MKDFTDEELAIIHDILQQASVPGKFAENIVSIKKKCASVFKKAIAEKKAKDKLKTKPKIKKGNKKAPKRKAAKNKKRKKRRK